MIGKEETVVRGRSRTPRGIMAASGISAPTGWHSEPEKSIATEGDWKRLDRFLCLGAESGPFKVNGFEASLDQNSATVRCIRADAVRVVGRVLTLRQQGRLAANGAGIFVMALVTALADDAGRSEACAGIPQICRTASDLFLFAERVTTLRGWGRGLRRAVGNWYRARYADDLAYQILKCPRRGGWSHRDLLRLAHPTPATREQAAVFRWILGGADGMGRRTVVRELPDAPTEDAGEGALGLCGDAVRARRFRAVTYPGVGELPRLLRGVEEGRRARTRDELVRLIGEYDLPREAIPGTWQGDREIWEALLHRMPLEGVLRHLSHLSEVGVLTPGSESAWWIENRLRDAEVLRGSGLHPMAFLLASRTYQKSTTTAPGRSWTPVPSVIDALNDAFYATFPHVRRVGRPMLLALDVSESTRTSTVPGSGLTVREAAAALALISMSTEPSCVAAALAAPETDARESHRTAVSGLTLLDLHPGMQLAEVLDRLDGLPKGQPDGSSPIEWARRHRVPVEAFVTFTDGDVWANPGGGPAVALKRYRAELGIDAKSVVVGMSGAAFELADPVDDTMLDVHGFDASTADVIAGFLRE